MDNAHNTNAAQSMYVTSNRKGHSERRLTADHVGGEEKLLLEEESHREVVQVMIKT